LVEVKVGAITCTINERFDHDFGCRQNRMQLSGISPQELQQHVRSVEVSGILQNRQRFANVVFIHPREQCFEWCIASRSSQQQRAKIPRGRIHPKFSISTWGRC
jgi:hypothetical protein